MKKASNAITENAPDRDTLISSAMRELDRMVTKGVLHKNNASRRKSRLMIADHKANPTSPPEAAQTA
jgi:ribosomal protein S20